MEVHLKTLIGVFRCEYGMSIRRVSLWVAFAILMVPHLTSLLLPPDIAGQIPVEAEAYRYAATNAFMLNLFMPVVGGILIADRLVRDQKTGMEELLASTPMERRTYVIGKYLGALFSIATPVLLTSLLSGVIGVASGGPLSMIPASLVAFLGINFPAYVFISAFSLGVPLVLPVRVYQVLFTGYWFWGNYLSPSVMPTLNGTHLTANGEFVLLGFFDHFFGMGGPVLAFKPSPVDAVINLALLSGLAALALFVTERVLAARARQK